jgi:xanthine phosphoribosyltransferase
VKYYYAYEEFKTDTCKLVKMVRPFEADMILTIARGGYTLSHALAEGLNIRNVQSVQTELYDATKKRENITMQGHYEIPKGAKVLLVDDIADTGETLLHVSNYIEQNFPEVTCKTVTLFYKKTSLLQPDFWVKEATQWIEFFWEKDFLIEE